jgi:hypothetical protein
LSTTLQLSVVDVVSATFSMGTPSTFANSARTSGRCSMYRSNAARFDPPVHETAALLCHDRVEDGLRHRPERAGVQVREALEHRELRPCLLERHATSSSTGA